METAMTALVVYDSAYGNTARIADAVAVVLEGREKAHLIQHVDPADLPLTTQLLVVGSPTQGGQPTKAMQAWLKDIPQDRLAGLRVAAFDTRMQARDQGMALRLLMNVIGYAAPRILEKLQARGGIAAAAAEGFVVEGREGPLHEGELERAGAWAKSLAGQRRDAA
jgi:flavodoxin